MAEQAAAGQLAQRVRGLLGLQPVHGRKGLAEAQRRPSTLLGAQVASCSQEGILRPLLLQLPAQRILCQ